MNGLLRYQLELLFRSQRWLPPLLTYVLLMVIGLTAGEALLSAYGYATAVLLPVTAWLVRCTVTAEGPAARACLAAAVGRPRVHLSAVVAAAVVAAGLGTAGFLVVWAFGGPTTVRTVPAVPPATLGATLFGAGLGTVVCVLLGLVVGVLAVRPVLVRAQYGIPLSLVGAVLLLALPGSPANEVVHSLITASRTGRVALPWLAAALVEAGLLAALATWGVCRLAGRRTDAVD
ncbi:hypothetical protein CFP65_4586 [Kitasatospora sp. MMS16-BH015]|uniref:ABC transporter n=1 Tax=Kitasatospora sp. MMS16-BH015 TaxID=2018025 RepID=UPI000CA1C710|nr:ABC transporter [Kitasatospora sp. MMS16-BH015]AUG79323.1 hypothetical protein CFP65_4586 [Kitasatospora sp. MMS16-BH015]